MKRKLSRTGVRLAAFFHYIAVPCTLLGLITAPQLLLAAIVRHGKTIIPGGLTAIEEGDSLVVVTRTTGLHDLKDILAD